MKNSRRAAVRAAGMAAASGAVLLLAPGVAVADHNEFPNCDSRHYPPHQCEGNQGGAGHEAPPLRANPSENVPPGTPVSMNSTGGCAPSVPRSVSLGLVHMSNSGVVRSLGAVDSDASGGYSATPVLPVDLPNGSYVIYGVCQTPEGLTTVSTSSFTVRGETTAAARTASARTGSSTQQGSTDTSEAGTASAAELPVYWTPPSRWAASEPTADAVTEAVNLRLAVMRTDLPATTAAPAATTPAVSSSTDLTPWYAAAGAVALGILGAAGWRRRTAVAKAGTEEVSQ